MNASDELLASLRHLDERGLLGLMLSITATLAAKPDSRRAEPPAHAATLSVHDAVHPDGPLPVLPLEFNPVHDEPEL